MTLPPPDAPTRVACELDLETPGKRWGNLRVPHSRDESAWGSLLVPLCVIAGADPGPTVLLTAGAHGDEYEGPVALASVARRLDPEDVAGRVVVLPAMNVAGIRESRRLNPADERNLNRCFPGRPDRGPTEALAHFVSSRLVSAADYVVDLHSGGTSLEFLPCAVVHSLEDPEQERRTRGLLGAFGAPASLVLTELDAEGLLDTAVERAGKVFLSTELGGGGSVDPEARRMGEDGVWRVLAHTGILHEEHPAITEAAARRASKRRLYEVLDDGYVIAESAGTFEPLRDLGESVRQGDPVARLHDLEHPRREPEVLEARCDGMVVCRRARAKTARGDCLVVLAGELEG